MKNTIKIFSIFLLGIAVLFVSCDRERHQPFPDAERVTFLSLNFIDGPPSWDEPLPPSSELEFNIREHEFGGTGFERAEIWVVKNPREEDYVATMLVAITNPLDLNGQNFTWTVQDILDATNTPALLAGDQYHIFYNIYMPDGVASIGWSKLTGFASFRVGEVEDANQTVQFNVICNVLTVDQFLGEWTYTAAGGVAPFIGSGGILDAVLDSVIGEGIYRLALTMRPGSATANASWTQTVRLIVNLNVYTWEWPRQTVMIPFAAAAQPGLDIGAGEGFIDTCTFPTIELIWEAWPFIIGTNSGWGAHLHTFTRIVPIP
ncbi:MAG: hypothetical protein FWC98_00970 [Bacteroidales bacterium]|nr:hypothetical protein [Bacteroidales bacterium]